MDLSFAWVVGRCCCSQVRSGVQAEAGQPPPAQRSAHFRAHPLRALQYRAHCLRQYLFGLPHIVLHLLRLLQPSDVLWLSGVGLAGVLLGVVARSRLVVQTCTFLVDRVGVL